MRHLSSERGVLPITIGLIVVVLVAVVGFAVYNVSKSHQNTGKTVGTSPSPTTSPTTKASASATPSASGYLDIKELGIKIRLTSDIADVEYSYDSQFLSKYPDPQQVGITSRSLVNAAANCKADTAGPLGTIGKTKNADQGFATLTPNNSTVFKFGDYYIYYKTPDTACGAPQGVLNQQLQSFKQAFATVQPD